jgi:hypothetical protein
MSKQTIESNEPSSIRLTLEKQIESEPQFWRKVHDSAKTTDGDTRKCFTRIYELIIMGEPTGIGIKFFYDYRRGGKSVATFDAIAIKALTHQIKGDYQEKIIKDYMDSHLDESEFNE